MGPAWQAIQPDLVPPEEFTQAVALSSLTFNAGRAIGPALAGALVATAGPGWAFLVNAASFLGVVIVLVWWQPSRPTVRLPAETLAGAMRAGLRYGAHSPVLRSVLVRTARVRRPGRRRSRRCCRSSCADRSTSGPAATASCSAASAAGADRRGDRSGPGSTPCSPPTSCSPAPRVVLAGGLRRRRARRRAGRRRRRAVRSRVRRGRRRRSSTNVSAQRALAVVGAGPGARALHARARRRRRPRRRALGRGRRLEPDRRPPGRRRRCSLVGVARRPPLAARPRPTALDLRPATATDPMVTLVPRPTDGPVLDHRRLPRAGRAPRRVRRRHAVRRARPAAQRRLPVGPVPRPRRARSVRRDVRRRLVGRAPAPAPAADGRAAT